MSYPACYDSTARIAQSASSKYGDAHYFIVHNTNTWRVNLTSVKSTINDNLRLPEHVRDILNASPKVSLARDRDHLISLSLGGDGHSEYEVSYEIAGIGNITEANVVRVRNGIAVNFEDPYMRRRDPNSMFIADELPTDKVRLEENFDFSFDQLRKDVFTWLKNRELVVVAFKAGGNEFGYDALLVAPANAAFFAAALADLQYMIPANDIPEDFSPYATLFLAPPFRHTHCKGNQVVIHDRQTDGHEIFALNLYPGPSAKKGIYAVLLNIGEKEQWLTAHGSSVQAITPYDNVLTIMHEGASGSGKSEMLEYAHREADGRLLVGTNTVSKEQQFLSLEQACTLQPVTDDMALCHPGIQTGTGKLAVVDAEDAWFVRVDHISTYGVDPYLESLCTHPPVPIMFLNIFAVPDATCLIWEATEDAPGIKCPNPRVILPRNIVPNVVKESVEIDVRSFGIRQPACTAETPTYGIAGMLHYLPPALGWLWRMVAPRGHANPSILGGNDTMESEGVGSYWPFATGRRVDQANLILEQILATPRTRFTLSPNQHIGAWKTGFMAQWLVREYLARRSGAHFREDQLIPSRCPLLGYTLKELKIEGSQISNWFTQVDTQPEVGTKGYDAGAEILENFFKQELSDYRASTDLHPIGLAIIECCMQGGSVEDYEHILPIT